MLKTKHKIVLKMEYRKRIETFKNWPVSFICKEELAKNGFYYIGVNDRVECHSCGIILENWERTDNVVQEHQRFSLECVYTSKKNKFYEMEIQESPVNLSKDYVGIDEVDE